MGLSTVVNRRSQTIADVRRSSLLQSDFYFDPCFKGGRGKKAGMKTVGDHACNGITIFWDSWFKWRINDLNNLKHRGI